jgi:hypothetical protein
MPKKVKRKKGRVIWLYEDVGGTLGRITEYYRWQAARNGKPVKFVECLT